MPGTIPETSKAVFDVLLANNEALKIENILATAESMITECSDLSKSSHYKKVAEPTSEEQYTDSMDFLQRLGKRGQRIIQALEKKENYRFLFQDVVLLKAQFQVLITYYSNNEFALKANYKIENSLSEHIKNIAKFIQKAGEPPLTVQEQKWAKEAREEEEQAPGVINNRSISY